MPRSAGFLGLAILATVAGCGPAQVYYREGASVDAVNRASLSCQTSALKQAPVANELRQRPPTYWPGRSWCDAAGCIREPGYWVDGGFYTVDRNAGLRGQVTTQCMADKGFALIELDRCSGSNVTLPATLPPLGAGSCAQKMEDGSFRVALP